MLRPLLACLFLLALLPLAQATLVTTETLIASPNGQVVVTVSLAEGRPSYAVDLQGRPLILPSALGLTTSQCDFSSNLRLTWVSDAQQVQHSYRLRNGKQSQIDKRATQQELRYTHTNGQTLSVLFQVFDQGVAFAYKLHGNANAQVQVTGEATEFQFAGTAKSFLHPMHAAHTGWARTNPSYESHYHMDQPVGQPSPHGQGWCFPALFHAPQVGWALVSETGVDGQYCGSHLAHDCSGGCYRIAFPQAITHRPDAAVHPTVAGNAQLPWRTIALGQTLGPIVQSTLATDLVQPKYDMPGPPALGTAAWSWVFLKDGQTTAPVQRDFIDMAAQSGMRYVLIDALWDTQIGREATAQLVAYAREKNVGVLLWYNSNPDSDARWNDATQSPKGHMHDSAVRRKEMAWLKQIGVAGLKVDFFGGDKQAVMQLYEGILSDAADFGLSINFHGTTLPRGWERMYPNFVTGEAVMGMEFITFRQSNADQQPEHCCMLPFTRNVVGPMDFTPTILSKRLAPNQGGPHRRTSDAFELALPVLFQSGVQHLGVTPAQVATQSEAVQTYLAGLPTTWDETRWLSGYPGKHVAVGRRSGNRWYVAAINGQDHPQTLELDLSFAPQATWQMLSDGPEQADFAPLTTSADSAPITLPANSGIVLMTE